MRQGCGHPSQEGRHPDRVEQPAERYRGCQYAEEQTTPLTAPERNNTCVIGASASAAAYTPTTMTTPHLMTIPVRRQVPSGQLSQAPLQQDEAGAHEGGEAQA